MSYLVFKNAKYLFFFLGLVLLVFGVFFFSQNTQKLVVKNNPPKNREKQSSQKGFFSKTLGIFFDENIDNLLLEQAAQGIFLQKDSLAAKGIVDYLVKANSAIPLTASALRFAIGQAMLGVYQPLEDAKNRTGEGKTNLERLHPPAEAEVFHALSIELMDGYATILSKILDTPRKEFKREVFGDSFVELRKTVDRARFEIRFLVRQFGFPYAPPKVIQFYDEAIGR